MCDDLSESQCYYLHMESTPEKSRSPELLALDAKFAKLRATHKFRINEPRNSGGVPIGDLIGIAKETAATYEPRGWIKAP